MKVDTDYGFRPVNILLETQEEVDKVYAVFNTPVIATFLDCTDNEGAFKCLEKRHINEYTDMLNACFKNLDYTFKT